MPCVLLCPLGRNQKPLQTTRGRDLLWNTGITSVFIPTSLQHSPCLVSLSSVDHSLYALHLQENIVPLVILLPFCLC